MAYDPVKAHQYYEAHKHLKGRKGEKKPTSSGSGDKGGKPQSKPALSNTTQAAKQKVLRLNEYVSKLQSALSEAEAELSKKRQAARQTEKQNSDGKSTAKEKQSAKEYRDKHKTEIAAKRKSSSSSGGGTSSSSSHSVSDMSVEELTSRIIKIKSALTDAKRQRAAAMQTLGSLAHSDIVSDSMSNAHFARFRSAERMPSK